ncbi:MAG: hypothetical protein BWY13_00293 [Euryarchaeota archaeon ADurb.Bin190]|nr:MAG: hypothetical protein BWY13_00293 [Euryarchaeota archaeon ADurb.Bin190]
MDVGQVDPAPGGGSAGLVLEDDGDVPVPLPGLGDEGVSLEDFAVPEVLLEPLEDGDVGGDDEKVPGQNRALLSQGVKVAPDYGQAHHLGLARAGGHLEGVLGPAVVVGINTEGGIIRALAKELGGDAGEGANAPHLVEVDECLNGFTLAEVVAEWDLLAVTLFQVLLAEPEMEQFPGGVRGSGIVALPPLPNRAAQVLGNGDIRRAAALNYLGRVSLVLSGRAISARLFECLV